MGTLEKIEKEIEQIKLRNERVEIDKAWETSGTRKLFLIIFTYLSIGIYMWVIGVNEPWLNAVIPSIGFLLSTLTLPFIKKYWKQHMYKDI
ncbi:hypothetical protein COY87_01500 [Candidatus Roizmanbacteria bacterium CG_4_10_14_0_8_um_filter_33_9]|uniref:Uncharacterized protein n=1 Tax=Candidatus Roizmanbacteria bacterium CG_4_10_14_0_8_um_filter_33_9 TaxID=1974826 RepID=A0A2M7QK19_9BACT|nr:MAG: hypothetical protein COY87_01500 [Candidatus Roizmanbacteria bacterium CG_4_10_14_0_8_um_filter_33_9]